MQFLKNFNESIQKQNSFVIKVERDMTVTPLKGEKYLNFMVRIFIDTDATSSRNAYTLDDVSLVKYELHPSYRNRIRVSEDRAKNFEAKVWTYGYYPVKATVYLKLGPPIILAGSVNFFLTPEEKEINKAGI